MLIANPPFVGLSPRMRGNPRRRVHQVPPLGSIPAHAGEPRWRVCDGVCHGVYPRACGGTSGWDRSWEPFTGLSPRMRGNHACGLQCPRYMGSIPAHAGEPLTWTPTSSAKGVYPRACGGTRVRFSISSSMVGLSPRMRGNPRPCGPCSSASGSIPAHAGEPVPAPPSCKGREVYPRACGGTRADGWIVLSCSGLSPRMRGNLGEGRGVYVEEGSIPAHAGEPAIASPSLTRCRVYPRACGGTLDCTGR